MPEIRMQRLRSDLATVRLPEEVLVGTTPSFLEETCLAGTTARILFVNEVPRTEAVAFNRSSNRPAPRPDRDCRRPALR